VSDEELRAHVSSVVLAEEGFDLRSFSEGGSEEGSGGGL